MKTLSGWIVGVFALGFGFGFGSFMSGSASPDLNSRDLEPTQALSATPLTAPAPRVVAGPGAPPLVPAPVIATSATPAPEPNAVEVYEDEAESDSRSWKESAVVIGGSAGAGAGIGAIAKGKKGAAVGAAIGAATGAAYELLKRDRKN